VTKRIYRWLLFALLLVFANQTATANDFVMAHDPVGGLGDIFKDYNFPATHPLHSEGVTIQFSITSAANKVPIMDSSGKLSPTVLPAFVGGAPFMVDNSDSTKKIAFNLAGVPHLTTRLMSPPTSDGTLATINGAESECNKVNNGLTLSVGFSSIENGAAPGTCTPGAPDTFEIIKVGTVDGVNVKFRFTQDSDLTFPSGGVVATVGKTTKTTSDSSIGGGTTVNLTTLKGPQIDISGSATISHITLNTGREVLIRFTGTSSLLNGSDLFLPGGRNITTAVNDVYAAIGSASGTTLKPYDVSADAYGILKNLSVINTPANTGSGSDTPLGLLQSAATTNGWGLNGTWFGINAAESTNRTVTDAVTTNNSPIVTVGSGDNLAETDIFSRVTGFSNAMSNGAYYAYIAAVGFSDGITSSGSPTVASATANFTSGDLHKQIIGNFTGLGTVYIGTVTDTGHIKMSTSNSSQVDYNTTVTNVSPGTWFTIVGRTAPYRAFQLSSSQVVNNEVRAGGSETVPSMKILNQAKSNFIDAQAEAISKAQIDRYGRLNIGAVNILSPANPSLACGGTRAFSTICFGGDGGSGTTDYLNMGGGFVYGSFIAIGAQGTGTLVGQKIYVESKPMPTAVTNNLTALWLYNDNITQSSPGGSIPITGTMTGISDTFLNDDLVSEVVGHDMTVNGNNTQYARYDKVTGERMDFFASCVTAGCYMKDPTGIRLTIRKSGNGAVNGTVTGIELGLNKSGTGWSGSPDHMYGIHIDSSVNLGADAWAIKSDSTAPSQFAGAMTLLSNLTVNGTVTLGAGVSEGYQETSTGATLTATSAAVTRFTGSSNQTFNLPDNTTLVAGRRFVAINSSTGLITVNNFTGGNITSIPAGQTQIIRCTSNSGPQTSWVLDNNAVVQKDSNGNASVNNIGTSAGTIVSAASTTVMTATSPRFQVITGTSTQTIKLPDVTTIPIGSDYYFKNESSSTGNVTIQSSGANTIMFLVGNLSAAATGVVSVSTTDNTATGWKALGPTNFVANSGKYLQVQNSMQLQGTDGSILNIGTGGNLGPAAFQGLPLAVGNGGTGLSSITANYLMIGNGTSAATLLAPGTAGYALISNGTSPTYSNQLNIAKITNLTTNGIVAATGGDGTLTTYPTVFPVVLRSVTMSTTAAGDLGTITIPAWVTKWRVAGSSATTSYSGFNTETFAGSYGSANISVWTATGGTGTQIMANALGPASTPSPTTNSWTGAGYQAVQGTYTASTVYVYQNAASSFANVLTYYLWIQPIL
jgi:hypothetical protein